MNAETGRRADPQMVADQMAYTLAEFLKSGVVLDDERLGYIEIQVNRSEWLIARQLLMRYGYSHHLPLDFDGTDHG